MPKPVLNLVSPKDRNPSRSLVIFPQDKGKKGYGGYLKIIEKKEDIPPYRIAFFVNEYDDGSINFSVKGPIRKKSNGKWLLGPRLNQKGQFLGPKGEVVEDKEDAANAFVYEKDSEGKLIFGVVASLWVTNIKKDKTPTKKTMISAKFFSDDEMNKINECESTEKRKDLKKSMGEWTTLFIEDGFQFLREIGCTVRE